jgi:hypothetical protein
MGLCAVSHWCEGCRDKGKARLSSALDRISERITLGFQTLSCPEVIRGSTIEKHKFTLYFNRIWRRECQSTRIEDKAFLIFLGQNPPFELRPKTGVSPPIFSWNPSWLIQILANPSISVGGGQQGSLAFALRRQRSHVRIVSGAPVLSGIFEILTLTENSRCHHSVTDNFKLAKAARGSFLITRPQRPRRPS